MNNVDIILLVVIFIVLYAIMIQTNKNTKKETEIDAESETDYFTDDIYSFDTKPSKRVKGFHEDIRAKSRVKSQGSYLDSLNNNGEGLDFVEMRYHTDYRDTMTAFNNIAPSQKQIFNVANQPVVFTNPHKKEVKNLVEDFIDELNRNIIEFVPDYRTNNSGWDEPLQDKKEGKDSFAKFMNSLGLPGSLYDNPAKKAPVELIKIDHVEKYESDDEIKYLVYLFVKKPNVKDQMVVRISFVLDKRIINIDRNFFDNHKESRLSAIIEEIFIMGYMVPVGVGRINRPRDSFYNFQMLEKDGIVDQEQIIKQLNRKLKERSAERDSFNKNLDQDTYNLKTGAPNLMNYESYQATQTIYDDFNNPRTFI